MAKSNHSRHKREVLSKVVLDDPQRAALGAVVAESSYLEAQIEMWLARLARIRPEDLEILVPRSAMLGTKINILSKLGEKRLRSKKKQKEFHDIVHRITNHNTERRNSVHGTWWHTKAKGIIDAARGLRGDPEARHASGGRISAREMMKLADKISETYWDLFDFGIANWLVPARVRALKRAQSKLK